MSYTTLQFGAVNSTGDRKALFLKKFGGEVLTAFEEANVVLDKHLVRTIDSGKSAQFPATWKVGAAYHTPGAPLAGQSSNANERVITIDDQLIADVFIANIDEAMNHYDVRSIYSTECGRALSNAWDRNVLQVGVLAARASATVQGAYGGSSLTNADFATDPADLAAGIFSAAQVLDEKDVPDNDRYAYVRPAQFYMLVQNKDMLNRDWGGEGSVAAGELPRIAGIALVKTNHLPSTNITSGPTKYQGDFTNTVFLVMNKMAVGTVKLLDLSMEMEYSARHQGTLILAKYAIGHGLLRPECAVEGKTA